jgi:transcriptional regulator with XRE-family HTH domain
MDTIKAARKARGKRMQRIREDLHFSQRKVADLVGVDPISVSRWERGEAWPREATRLRVAAVLGVTVATLEGYEASPELTPRQMLALVADELPGEKHAGTDRRQRQRPYSVEKRGVAA